MSTRARWLLVAVILLVAVAVAVWPRGSGGDAAPPAPSPGPDVAVARAEAALPPCATGGPGPSELRGVALGCLGTGAAVDAATALGGRDLLLNVWATWCMPCREELPLLAEYAAQPGAVEVVTVAVRSPEGDSLVLLRNLGVRLPALLDREDAFLRGLRVPDALPASYLIRADGTVALVTQPRLFRSVDDVRAAVTGLRGGDG